MICPFYTVHKLYINEWLFLLKNVHFISPIINIWNTRWVWWLKENQKKKDGKFNFLCKQKNNVQTKLTLLIKRWLIFNKLLLTKKNSINFSQLVFFGNVSLRVSGIQNYFFYNFYHNIPSRVLNCFNLLFFYPLSIN